MRLGNIITMGASTVMANMVNKRIPLNVMLSVTNRCTSHCSYCKIPERKQRELTTVEIFALIDEASRIGCQRLGLWGGEPLMREDIADIIEYAKTKHLFVTLDSNGYQLAEKIRFLTKLDHLILAFDGPEEVHDLNRGQGSFKRVMSAIESASGRLPLWTITVLTKNNLQAIDYILDCAKKYGFLATFQLLHHNERLSRDHQNLLPSSDEYRNAIRKLIEEKKKGASIASSFKYLFHILHWPDYRIPTSMHAVGRLACWAGKLYCNVDTDGSVYPCSLLVDKIGAPNFLEVGFREAFRRLQNTSCKSCIASCFTEYNYLFSLDAGAIVEWLRSMRRSGKTLWTAVQ